MMLSGIRIVQIARPTITIPAKRHPRKKWRLQNKWRKRYGMVTIADPSTKPDDVLFDSTHNVAYVYPEGVQRLRERIPDTAASPWLRFAWGLEAYA